MTSGRIFDIKRFSIHDGPGIRTTVFLQGCPLSCPWCHNPESQEESPFVHYDPERCIGCEACVGECPEHALQLTAAGVRVDGRLCRHCGRCVEVCPSTARVLVGRSVTVDNLISVIEKDVPFYDESGGGATFSGGEPLLQPEFLLASLAECRARDIHTAVDTTGAAPHDVLVRVAEETDLFLYDLKLMDDARHVAVTGASNVGLLANLEHLVKAGAAVHVRVPLIHGVNDDDDNIEATTAYVRALAGVRQVSLLPFHASAEDKHHKFDMPWRMNGDARMSDERVRDIESRFTDAGLDVTIGG